MTAVVRSAPPVASALLAALVASAVRPAPARADHDIAANASFWAYSADGQHFLVHIDDENRGIVLAVKQVGRQASVHEVVAGDVPPEALVRSPPLVDYQFVDPGVKTPDSPDAKVKILTSPAPTTLQVFMTDGENMTPMFSLPLRRSGHTGEYAKAAVKEVVWNRTGHSGVIIVDQVVSGPYAMDVDQVISFPALPYRQKLAAKRKAAAGGAKGPAR